MAADMLITNGDLVTTRVTDKHGAPTGRVVVITPDGQCKVFWNNDHPRVWGRSHTWERASTLRPLKPQS